jgi:hypothetical protein
MKMLESCARFRAMDAPELADLLTRYVTRVRQICIDPEAPLPAKLAAIEAYTDQEVAPPPPPGSGTGEGQWLAVTHSPVPAL